MPNCKWETKQDGAEVLIIDGTEKVRISDARNMRQDEGKPGASTITVDQLMKDLEKMFSCG